MRLSHMIIPLILAAAITACNQESGEPMVSNDTAAVNEGQAVTQQTASNGDVIEVAPGLNARILKNGYGRVAEAGDYVEVHYTGWLFDDQAEDSRGDKFDSSVDRGEKFHFMLGTGQVIKGWDQGVAGMLIGEKRELTLAPEMGYGDRGAGNVIPPGATLVFEVELFGLEGPSDSK